MIAMKIFYPNHKGARFDLEYYVNCHMRKAKELAGDYCKGISVESAVLPEDSPYIAIGTEYYESIEDYHTALDPYREMLREDIARFTDIVPVIQFFEVQNC